MTHETIESQRQYILFLEKKIFRLTGSIESLQEYAQDLVNNNQDLKDLIETQDREINDGK